jgi:hypothetical protein
MDFGIREAKRIGRLPDRRLLVPKHYYDKHDDVGRYAYALPGCGCSVTSAAMPRPNEAYLPTGPGVKPIAGNEWCQGTRFQFQVSTRPHVVMEDGTEWARRCFGSAIRTGFFGYR